MKQNKTKCTRLINTVSTPDWTNQVTEVGEAG